MVQTLSSPAGRIGSMTIFWPLIEPILAALPARRICDIGVAEGAFSSQLRAWAREHGCAYVGVDPNMSPSTDGPRAADGHMLKLHSLDVLPTLERCDAYFLDGDHNFFTVRNELTLITGGLENCQPAPVIFVHDVGWPWGRRDMYYLPSTVPANARQVWSETLGVSLEGDELIDGGLREPGRYAISVSANGARNGVLTAVEDFLASHEGAGWSAIILPVAYGLAMVCQQGNSLLPAACREKLQALREATSTTAPFLQACEQNYLQLYLRGEYAQHLSATALNDLQTERAAHFATLAAYAELLEQYRALDGEYSKLLQAYHSLGNERQGSSR